MGKENIILLVSFIFFIIIIKLFILKKKIQEFACFWRRKCWMEVVQGALFH